MLNSIKRRYIHYEQIMENIIFPLILLVYPLVNINQGIDVSDTTYSLGNFMFFEQMDVTWAIATYLSNVIGTLLIRLPFGDMLLGMNFYTSLLVSGTALLAYYFFKKEMPPWIVWLGEIIAIGMCWIPTVILYNYLTYLFFALGFIFLYKGILTDHKKYFVIAGIWLGMNVMARTSNLTQMALIVGLWYACIYRKESFQKIVEKTAYCLLGYLLGVGVPFMGVLFQYGFGGIIDMVNGLAAIQSVDETYTTFSMIQSTIDAYVRSGKWMFFILAGVVLGSAMFLVAKTKWVFLKKIAYCGGILLLLRFFWGRGMFSFRYYEAYSSIFEWGMVALYLSIFAAILVMVGKQFLFEEKLMAVFVLIVIIITPLGSNNYTYQNLNNLFMVAPFTIYIYYKLASKAVIYCNAENGKQGNQRGLRLPIFPWLSMVVVLGIVIFIQSIGFHSQFVFQDGIDGEPRNATFSSPKVVWGMSTTYTNADSLGGLISFCEEEGLAGEDTIFYGDVPGLSYLLQMPFVLGSAWLDLDSYPMIQMEQGLAELETCPIIMIREREYASVLAEEKKELLLDYIERYEYEKVYDEKGYAVYTVMIDK